jgi:hypothetical protein
MEDIYRVGGQNLIFLETFFIFFGAITVKTTSFSIKMIKFIFKQSNLNLNNLIR